MEKYSGFNTLYTYGSILELECLNASFFVSKIFAMYKIYYRTNLLRQESANLRKITIEKVMAVKHAKTYINQTKDSEMMAQ